MQNAGHKGLPRGSEFFSNQQIVGEIGDQRVNTLLELVIEGTEGYSKPGNEIPYTVPAVE
jgi:hypothetical protein